MRPTYLMVVSAGLWGLLGATGCGGGDGDANNAAGSSGGSNSGGSSSGGSASGASSSGGSNSGGSNSGGSQGEPAAACEPGQAKLTYEDGIEAVYDLASWPPLYGADMGQARRFSSRLGDGIYEIVFEPQIDATSAKLPGIVLDTQPWPVRRAILAHATKDTLGPVRCVTEGSGSTVARDGDELLLDFKNMDVMAACADRAVPGEIHLCFGRGDCDGFEGGSVNGTPWVLQPDTWVGALGSWSVEFEDGSYMRAQTGPSTEGPTSWALIVTSPSGPYGGAIYCASGGTIGKTENTFGTVMHWTGLGELSCGAGAGTARGCLEGKPPPQ